MIGYIALAFGIQSKTDLEAFKKEHFPKRSFFKRFSFFKKKEKETFEKEDDFKKALSKALKKAETLDLYSPHTHKKFLQNLKDPVEKWIVFSLSPIFNSQLLIKGASFFAENLEKDLLNKIFWIRINKKRSLIAFYQKKIKEFLIENNLAQKETILIFASTLDDLSFDFQQSFKEFTKEILKGFPYIVGKNIFSLEDLKQIEDYKERKNVIFISLSSLAPSYENFILEKKFLPPIKDKGLALFSFKYSFDKDFEELLLEILDEELTPNNKLI